jgi:uncharacterized membrane protein
MSESRRRGLVKAITYRLLQSLNTFFISLLVTGELETAATIVSIELVVKIFVYFWHERIWNLISWGKLTNLNPDSIKSFGSK